MVLHHMHFKCVQLSLCVCVCVCARARSPLSSSVGRRDGYGQAGGVRALGGGRWPAVGPVQAGARGLRHQEAADLLCGGGRQGGHRHAGGGDHPV